MRFSVSIVPTDRTLPVVELARAVEDRELDGLWFPDHTHIPVSRRSAYPMGGELPERYSRNLETLVSLALAAAATSRIRLGSGILLAALRDPILTAKALATLDHQSGGRLAVGVGYGWNVEEIVDHDVDPRTRRRRTREHVLTMQAIWANEVAAFSGEFVDLSPSWSWPKPCQQVLPVLVGGGPTDTVFAHVAEFATGWIPAGGGDLAQAVPRLRERFEGAGREPGDLQIIPFTTAALDHGKIDAFAAAGATEVAFEVIPATASGVLSQLDDLAAFVALRRTAG